MRASGREEAPIATDSDPHAESSAAPARYERLDVPALLPFWLGLLIAAFIAGVLLSISVGFPRAVKQQTRGPLQVLPAAPRLQSAPVADLLRYDGAKREEVDGRKGATAIDAAMRATARQGWGPPK